MSTKARSTSVVRANDLSTYLKADYDDRLSETTTLRTQNSNERVAPPASIQLAALYFSQHLLESFLRFSLFVRSALDVTPPWQSANYTFSEDYPTHTVRHLTADQPPMEIACAVLLVWREPQSPPLLWSFLVVFFTHFGTKCRPG